MSSEARKQYMRDWREKNRPMIQAYDREWYGPKAERRQAQYRYYRTGITQDQFDAKLKEQGGVCGLCFLPFIEDEPKDADHDHETGRFRGVLHRKCNLGLGTFDDSIERLEQTILYLKRNQTVR